MRSAILAVLAAITLVMQPGGLAAVPLRGIHEPDPVVRMYGHSAGFSFRMPDEFVIGPAWSTGVELIEGAPSRARRAISVDMRGGLVRLPSGHGIRRFQDGKAVHVVSYAKGGHGEGTWSLLAVWESPRGPVALRARQAGAGPPSPPPDFRWAWAIFETLDIR